MNRNYPAHQRQTYESYNGFPGNSRDGTRRGPAISSANREQPAIFPPRFMLKTAGSRPQWDLSDSSIPFRKRRRDGGREMSPPTAIHPIRRVG